MMATAMMEWRVTSSSCVCMPMQGYSRSSSTLWKATPRSMPFLKYEIVLSTLFKHAPMKSPANARPRQHRSGLNHSATASTV